MDDEDVPLLEGIAPATDFDLIEKIDAARSSIPRYAERHSTISRHRDFRGRFCLYPKHILFRRSSDYSDAIFRRGD